MNGIENENAVSQVIAVILLVVLAIGIAMVIQSALMGTASDLRKSAFIASEADVLQVVQFGVPVEVLKWMRKTEIHFTSSARKAMPAVHLSC